MTGRDLIVYILQKGLENEPVFIDHNVNLRILGLKSLLEAAAEEKTGVATLRTLCAQGKIEYVNLGSSLYIIDDKKNVISNLYFT